MDATDASPERLDLAVERFLAGDALEFHGVVLRSGPLETITVESFSDWPPEQTSAAHAAAQIERSKQVLHALVEASPRFAQAAVRRHAEYVCCYNYGNGSVALAREANGVVQWLG
mgnify:CR=1 FL=1